MMRGDTEAIRLLTIAGAETPQPSIGPDVPVQFAKLADSVRNSDPMFRVLDMRATVRWYLSIGFTLVDSHEVSGELVLAKLSFGKGHFGLSPGATTGPRDVSLWFYSDRVQELYRFLKERRGATGDTAHDQPEVRFEEDLYEPFYGGRQFSIRDPNGLALIFWHPEWLTPHDESAPGG